MTESAREQASSEQLANVLRRIQKLLAIANDHRADPNEAAAAAGQAEKIMRHYQLENADVLAAQMTRGDKGTMTFKAVFGKMRRDDPSHTASVKNPPWAQFLAVAVGQLHGCEVRQGTDVNQHGHRAPSLRFYGFHADVELCAFTFEYLVTTLIIGARNWQAGRGKAAQEAYRKGFVHELTARLARMAAERERDLQSGVASRALVVSKKQAIVEAFGEFRYREAGAAKVADMSGYMAGRRDASKVDVERRAVTGGQEQRMALK